MSANNIVWNDNQIPMSIHFDDVYFSNDDAIAETDYVFIAGNKLTERFLQHQKSIFTVGETGFGSGLNFFIVWQQFLLFKLQNPNHILKNLQFFSIEKYPLSLIELQAIHQKIITNPALSSLAEKLQNHWPCHHKQFDDVLLNVLFADIEQFTSHLKIQNTLIDAWFFDGFSPAKNPDMWSEKLFTDLYQVTNINGTFATFTAAGQVRRNLINAGFKVNKQKGYGKKREMLIGYKMLIKKDSD